MILSCFMIINATELLSRDINHVTMLRHNNTVSYCYNGKYVVSYFMRTIFIYNSVTKRLLTNLISFSISLQYPVYFLCICVRYSKIFRY